MADFEFFDWERLSPDVTDGEAHLRFSVKGEEWLFRQCGSWWFARKGGSVGKEGNFLFRVALAVASYSIWFPDESTLPADVRHFLESVDDDEASGACFRVWILDESANASVMWNKVDGWVWGVDAGKLGDNRSDFPFRFETPFAVPQMNSQTLFPLLANERENPASEMSFAARFAALSELERRLQGVETRFGTPQEFAQTVICALRAFAAQWPVGISVFMVNFNAVGSENRFVRQEESLLGIRERAILGHIERAFEPHQLPDAPDLPLAVQTFTRNGWTRSFSIEVACPSMHERLEAMLELRAWLETHWPDGVKHLSKVV